MRRILVFLILAVSASCLFAVETNAKEMSFRSAKKILAKLYSDHRRTFYCDCKFDKHKKVKPRSCGLVARKQKKRASRIEWEHIVPAHAFGHTRRCWREKICNSNGKPYKGRRCCTKTDKVFKAMEADLHNLVPAVGELNGDRSNRSFSMVYGEPRAYGACDFEIDFDTDKVEPRPEVRGNIARTYFYFKKQYGLPISKKQKKLFDVWNRSDPVDQWERDRNFLIKGIQGNGNPFIE